MVRPRDSHPRPPAPKAGAPPTELKRLRRHCVGMYLCICRCCLSKRSERALIGNVWPKRKHAWFEFQFGDGHDVCVMSTCTCNTTNFTHKSNCSYRQGRSGLPCEFDADLW